MALLVAPVYAERNTVPSRLAVHVLRETKAGHRDRVRTVLFVAEVSDPAHDFISPVIGCPAQARIVNSVGVLVRNRVVRDVEELLAHQAEISLNRDVAQAGRPRIAGNSADLIAWSSHHLPRAGDGFTGKETRADDIVDLSVEPGPGQRQLEIVGRSRRNLDLQPRNLGLFVGDDIRYPLEAEGLEIVIVIVKGR